MIAWLATVRASWLAGISCAELLAACETEMFQTLALNEYSKLGWLEWSQR